MTRVQAITVPSESEHEQADAAPPNPLMLIHNCLRGRYHSVAVLLVIGGLVGAATGYIASAPSYRCVGQVQIKPNMPRILYENEQNATMPRFDAFVESQITLIKSSRVIEAAAQSKLWQQTPGVRSPGAGKLFENLEVTRTKNGEILTIACILPDPRQSQTAVQSVTETYVQLYVSADAESARQRLEVLETRRGTLATELNELEGKIVAIANEYGSKSLDPVYQAKLGELQKLESELNRVRLTIANVDDDPQAPTTAPAQASQQQAVTLAMTPEVAARFSPEVRDQLRRVRDSELELTRMEGRLGNSHPEVVENRRVAAKLQADLENAVTAFQLAQEQAPRAENPAGSPIALPSELTLLRQREQKIQKLYESVKIDAVSLGRKQLAIDSLRAEAGGVKTKLDEVDRRIDQLNVESALSGRVSVISNGELPRVPYKDRRAAFTTVGGIGGAGLGPAILILFGLLDSRFRTTTDARQKLGGGARILGALPHVAEGEADPEALAAAAHGVHQIRVLLQVQANRDGRRVFAMTSPTPGTGKTSITSALGYSFAASNSRTLLIDLDLLSGGLSSRVPMVPVPVLPSPGTTSAVRYIAPPKTPSAQPPTASVQSDDQTIAQHLQQTASLPTVEGMLGNDALAEVEDNLSASGAEVVPIDGSEMKTFVVRSAGAAAGSSRRRRSMFIDGGELPGGLLDLIEGRPLNECVWQTDVPHLSILPLGGAGPQQVSRLSPEMLRRIIREARSRFETILIDTGPVLGSIEASMVAAEADAVLMAVSRGEQRANTEQALEMVMATGANIGGIIFNRAAPSDVMMSGSSAQSRSGFSQAAIRLRGGKVNRSGSGMGPLARAVVSTGSPVHMES
jgi:polysaccharide biosynthesis transport protein